MGKSGPNATFDIIFLGLGWPWVGEFVGFIIIFIWPGCVLVYRKTANMNVKINTDGAARRLSLPLSVRSRCPIFVLSSLLWHARLSRVCTTHTNPLTHKTNGGTHAVQTVRDFTSVPRLIIIRSFDVNKPGEEVEHLRGGESTYSRERERASRASP